jgi:hypothetical protein
MGRIIFGVCYQVSGQKSGVIAVLPIVVNRWHSIKHRKTFVIFGHEIDRRRNSGKRKQLSNQ